MNETMNTNVTLVPFIKEDTDEYLKLANEEQVEKFFKLAYCRNKSEANDIIELFTTSEDYIAFKILNCKNQFVGIIVGEKKEKKKTIEISYFIGKEFRKKKYCKNAIIEYAKYIAKNFSQKYKNLEFCISIINYPSKNVMNTLGIKLAYTRGYAHYRCPIRKLI